MSIDIKNIKNFLFDLDGTTYLGKQLLPGAKEIIEHLKSNNKKHLFFTNNSSKNSKDYADKISKLGIPCSVDNVLTSGDATMIYLQKQKYQNIFLLGTPNLEASFKENGFNLVDDKSAQAVVLGFDLTLDYKKIQTAYEMIMAGLPFIATHPDVLCPIENGYLLDIGAMISMFEKATGKSPTIIGKPYPLMIEMALERLQGTKEETVMIGDRLYTDMQMAQNAGTSSALVLSGETKQEDLANSPLKPDFVFQNLADFLKHL